MGMPVRYDVDARVATITIDRPEAMNALDPPMLFGLAEDRVLLLPGLDVAIFKAPFRLLTTVYPRL